MELKSCLQRTQSLKSVRSTRDDKDIWGAAAGGLRRDLSASVSQLVARSMGSVQNGPSSLLNRTGSIRALKDLFESKMDTQPRAVSWALPPRVKVADATPVVVKKEGGNNRESRSSTGAIEFERIGESQYDEKRISTVDLRDNSPPISVKAISALYLSKVRAVELTRNNTQLPSKVMLHQQRQKCELRRLLKHTHPELKTLDGVMDEELAELQSRAFDKLHLMRRLYIVQH
ncbi:hypothetical protein CRUP_009377 [Coryphaenoides rupestris]|nr:hypothetical protein CRUP_009377 [Coryphaenoides rupestris]